MPTKEERGGQKEHKDNLLLALTILYILYMYITMQSSSSISPRSRPPVGIVQRMAQEHENGVNSGIEVTIPSPNIQKMAEEFVQQQMAQEKDNNGIAAVSSSYTNLPLSIGRDAASMHRAKLAKAKQHRQRKARLSGGGGSSSGGGTSGSSSISSVGNNAATDKYTSNIKTSGIGDDHSANSSVGGGGSILRAAHSYISHSDTKTNATASKHSGGSYHIGLPSLLTNNSDEGTIDSNFAHREIMDTELFLKFEEAFNLTLRNHPGILPGAPTVIDSIKQSLYKVQQTKVKKEKEMRIQLSKVKAEKDQMEQQLRKEMGTTALRRNELTKELEASTAEKDVLQESLTKQTAAIAAVKQELKAKMSDVTKEKEELTKHLGFLSKSRAELEKALETEMKAVEKDRDALKNIVTERKKLAKQKNDNKELEVKIERMTQAASKEKKALQSEVADLKKFEQHIANLRKANEKSRHELEEEKLKLKEVAGTMQTKTSTLAESLKELQGQYQEEIDELKEKIKRTKMMHEQDMEMVVKSKVMNYLGGRAIDSSSDTHQQNGDVGPQPTSASPAITTPTPSNDIDIESIIKERVQTELKKRENETEKENDAAEKPMKNQSSNKDYKEGRMRREIDRLRDELELVQVRGERNNKYETRDEITTPRERVDERLRAERDEMALREREMVDERALRDRTEMRYSSPGSRISTLRNRDALISPRYGLNSVGGLGGGGGYGRYSEDAEDDNDILFSTPGSRSHNQFPPRHHHMSTPPLSQRPTRGRRSLEGRTGGSPRRYYF